MEILSDVILAKHLFKKYYRPNSNILDIGGFIGTVSLVLSEVINKDYKIYVFEPQYYDCLIKNIKDDVDKSNKSEG